MNYVVTLYYKSGKKRSGLFTDDSKFSIIHYYQELVKKGKIKRFTIRKINYPLYNINK